LRQFRADGLAVAARKPAQSFDIDVDGARLGGATDAEVLAAASGEDPSTVCHPHRSYHRAMAPPMAAEALGLPPLTVAELMSELEWPDHRVDRGVVEMAGGVRSPMAADGDTTDVVAALLPDMVVLVADAGLGTINAVRMSMDALDTVCGGTSGIPVAVVLDRFDGHHDIHRRNRAWLEDRLGYLVVTLPGEEARLAEIVGGGGTGPDPGP
jgi:dethiobiotin synthetase